MDIGTIVLPLHLLSLAYVAWNVVHADHLGFNWIRGKEQVLNVATVQKYHKGSWIGLGLMIVTGGNTLFATARILTQSPTVLCQNGFRCDPYL